MNIPRNLEHLEALQEDLNKKQSAMVSILPKEERDKYTAVGQAMEILTESGVKCFLFAELKDTNPNFAKDENLVVKQYNNLYNLIEKENGEYTLDGKKNLARFNHRLIYSIITFFELFVKGKATYISEILEVVGYIAGNQVRKFRDGTELPCIVELENK